MDADNELQQLFCLPIHGSSPPQTPQRSQRADEGVQEPAEASITSREEFEQVIQTRIANEISDWEEATDIEASAEDADIISSRIRAIEQGVVSSGGPELKHSLTPWYWQ